jgi:hypothetical protein
MCPVVPTRLLPQVRVRLSKRVRKRDQYVREGSRETKFKVSTMSPLSALKADLRAHIRRFCLRATSGHGTYDFRDSRPQARDHVIVAPGQTVQARAMYDAHKAWCAINAKHPVFETKFGRVMKMRFPRDEARLRVYLDVKLVDPPKLNSKHVDEGAAARRRCPLVALSRKGTC